MKIHIKTRLVLQSDLIDGRFIIFFLTDKRSEFLNHNNSFRFPMGFMSYRTELTIRNNEKVHSFHFLRDTKEQRKGSYAWDILLDESGEELVKEDNVLFSSLKINEN